MATKIPFQERKYHDDELVINYNDACIYGRDLKLMESKTSWWNDACIHYQFERLQHSQTAAANSATGTKPLLLDPAVVSFLMHQLDESEHDEILDFCRGYNQFANVDSILIPINDTHRLDNSEWHVPGQGTHWSLLAIIFIKTEIVALHFDSMENSSNQIAAKQVANKWYRVYSFACTIRSPPSSLCLDVMNCQTPQQENGYDCALHVLAVAQAIVTAKEDEVTSHSANVWTPQEVRRAYERCVESFFFTYSKGKASTSSTTQALRQDIAQDVRHQAEFA